MYKIYSGNILSDITDHFSSYVIITTQNRPTVQNERPQIRLFTEKQKQNFYHHLSAIDQSDIYHSNDVNIAYNAFINTFTATYNIYFPLTRQSKKGFRDKMWITPAIRNSNLHKNKLYKKWVNTKNRSDYNKYIEYEASSLKR